MKQEFLSQVEDAALNAWPSLRQMVYDGWLLRFTGGESKRVNSVNIRHASTLSLLEKITFCENIYKSQSLPVLFRCPEPFTSSRLTNALSLSGYHMFDTTYVLGREIKEPAAVSSSIEVREMDPYQWIGMRAGLFEKPVDRFALHAKILRMIVPKKVLMGLFADDQPVACGMGVLQGSLLGFFSIFTGKFARGNGYGSAAMGALTRWGIENGASFGYLQVEGDNQVAQSMYKKLGFSLLYRYSYFRKTNE